MIIRVKKRDLLILSIALILVILIPYVYAQVGTAAKTGLGVWLIISNRNPTNISLLNATFTANPISGGDASILITFNASDADGAAQLNGTTGGRVIVNLTLGNPSVAQFRTQTSCGNVTVDSDRVQFNCTILMRYYDNASAAWVINVTVIDSGSGSSTNDTVTFTYDDLAAFSIRTSGANEQANLNFSNLNLGQSDVAAKAPVILNNTGNNDFDQINITAAALILVGGSDVINAGQFAVNVTNNTLGQGLPLTTAPQTIPGVSVDANATLPHGPGISGDSVPYPGTADFKSKGNQTLIFFVDVPTGIGTGTYNNTWNMTVVDLT